MSVPDPQHLAEKAWGMIEVALRTGIVEFEEGKPIELRPSEIATLLKYVSSVKEKRRKTGGLVSDFMPPETST